MPHAVAMVHRLVEPEPSVKVALHQEMVLATDGAIDLDASVPLRVEPGLSRQRRAMRRPLALGGSDFAACAHALVVQGAVAEGPAGASRLRAPGDRTLARVDLLAVMVKAQTSGVEPAGATIDGASTAGLATSLVVRAAEAPANAVRSQSTIAQRRP
jgi:hypothetical protein